MAANTRSLTLRLSRRPPPRQGRESSSAELLAFVHDVIGGLASVQGARAPVAIDLDAAEGGTEARVGTKRKAAPVSPCDYPPTKRVRTEIASNRFAVLDAAPETHLFHSSGTKDFGSDATRAVSKEWKVLGDSVPEGVYCRGFSDRLDLVRFLIVGAPGTLYCHSFFLFDARLPGDYPRSAPSVQHHCYDALLHNYLHPDGKVCLSLLGTIPVTDPRAAWQPGESTLLQVVTSIQGLVLGDSQTGDGVFTRMEYFVRSLQHMLRLVNEPPPELQDVIWAHFAASCGETLAVCRVLQRAADTLSAADRALVAKFAADAFVDYTSYIKPRMADVERDLVAAIRIYGDASVLA